MRAIEIARRMAELGQMQEASKAYELALTAEKADAAVEEKFEAAVWLLQSGWENYKPVYDAFLDVYADAEDEGIRADAKNLLTGAFYEPNVKDYSGRYERNCKLLARYAYFFPGEEKFLPFEELNLRFYPYDEGTYCPFDGEAFAERFQPMEAAIRHWFFEDLSKPVLAEDVYSQYELEYLCDNVRRSEDVGFENHIYLHYTDWERFCAYLQVLNLRPLLESKKFVVLIGDEVSRYPIDFEKQYGVNYSRSQPKPVAISEVTRLIWHAQLSTHNGGDFFNEVFDAHPNLLALSSMMLGDIENNIRELREAIETSNSAQEAREGLRDWNGDARLVDELYRMRGRLTDKDLLVALYMGEKPWNQYVDPASRIVPALFFQPHFHNIVYELGGSGKHRTLVEPNVEKLVRSKMVRGFKYIKTFTPMRRFTTSHGATVRFMDNEVKLNADKGAVVVPDAISERILNRSFLADTEDRLFHDSVVVRLEDGKLNPKATFTAMAAFLDLPYTESMTRCTEMGKEIGIGFDPAPIYKTYDDFINDDERYFIEYVLRSVYRFYGYEPMRYDGAEVDEARLRELIAGFTTMNHYIRESWKPAVKDVSVPDVPEEVNEQIRQQLIDKRIEQMNEQRLKNALIMSQDPILLNRDGRPMQMTPILQLDPALVEQPIYH